MKFPRKEKVLLIYLDISNTIFVMKYLILLVFVSCSNVNVFYRYNSKVEKVDNILISNFDTGYNEIRTVLNDDINSFRAVYSLKNNSENKKEVIKLDNWKATFFEKERPLRCSVIRLDETKEQTVAKLELGPKERISIKCNVNFDSNLGKQADDLANIEFHLRVKDTNLVFRHEIGKFYAL